MLIISKNQFDNISNVSHENTKARLLKEIIEFGPEISNIVGIEAMKRFVDFGCKKSNDLGFNRYGTTRLYLQLMMSFGSGFDKDIQLPWASSIIRDNQIPDQKIKAQRLWRSAHNYRQKILGNNLEHIQKALKRSLHFLESVEEASGNAENWLPSRLRSAFPQKADYIGPDKIQSLIELAELRTRHIEGNSTKNTCLYASFLFAFGQHVFDDPLYPWISDAIKMNRRNDRGLERLRRRTKTYLLEMYKNSSGALCNDMA